jgi:hypothetical protein
MAGSQPLALIAAPMAVVNKLRPGVEDHLHVIAAETYEDALPLLRERQVDLLIVCYIFDGVRPYRLLNHLPELEPRPRAMLVRALPVPLREEEQSLRASYATLGVGEFQNFSDQERSIGREAALQEFRRIVLGLMHAPA